MVRHDKIIPKNCLFEIFERNEHRSDVVQSSSQKAILEDVVYADTAKLVHRFHVWIEYWQIFCAIPDHLHALFVRKSIENSITAQQNKIVLFLYLEGLNFGSCN